MLREDLGNAYALPTECYPGPHRGFGATHGGETTGVSALSGPGTAIPTLTQGHWRSALLPVS
ncbi:MAG: hypothetical protein M1600_08300 [Firmicutes bacterium]|nr:hypothetical protein [Bacillota bacterium]